MIVAIALDLGSTSVKAGLLDQQGTLSGILSFPAPTIRGFEGRYESDALEYAAIADNVLKHCLAQTQNLPALGICSQRSSFLIWEQASGIPLTPLISWQDARGAASCAALQAEEPLITRLTGLRLTPYYFATKLRIVLQENPHWRARLENGALRVGTLDTFLIWRWTDGKLHLSDASMAARTLLMDIHKQEWSPRLCDLFEIPMGILPTITASNKLNVPLNNGLLLQASVGDQSASLIASVGEARDVALVNLGTGGFVIRYMADDKPKTDGYLRTLVYQSGDQPVHIAIEGTLNSIAAALADYPVTDCTMDDLASHAEIYCVAEPSGLGAPYFRQDIGLQFSVPVAQLTKKEIACLLLEAIIFRVVRIVEDFHQDAPINRVYLSGGLSELTVLQQGLAQCLSCEVYCLGQHESSLQGAAILASGLMPIESQQIKKIWQSDVNIVLRDKYHHWKNWLDSVLAL